MKRYVFFWNIWLWTLLFCFGPCCGQVFAENDVEVQSGTCAITSGGHTYRSSGCLITMGKDVETSWYIIEKKNGSPLLERIPSVSMVEISPGTAEVSGLTQDGINSRWGQARRDGACWCGEDFRICIEQDDRYCAQPGTGKKREDT